MLVFLFFLDTAELSSSSPAESPTLVRFRLGIWNFKFCLIIIVSCEERCRTTTIMNSNFPWISHQTPNPENTNKPQFRENTKQLQTIGSESLYFPKTDTKKREFAREKREPKEIMSKKLIEKLESMESVRIRICSLFL